MKDYITHYDIYLSDTHAKRKWPATIVAAIENFPILQSPYIMCLEVGGYIYIYIRTLHVRQRGQ